MCDITTCTRPLCEFHLRSLKIHRGFEYRFTGGPSPRQRNPPSNSGDVFCIHDLQDVRAVAQQLHWTEFQSARRNVGNELLGFPRAHNREGQSLSLPLAFQEYLHLSPTLRTTCPPEGRRADAAMSISIYRYIILEAESGQKGVRSVHHSIHTAYSP